MGNPIKLRTDDDLQQMTTAETDYIQYVILNDFANTSTTGVGTVSVNPASTSGLTLIGTFANTRRTESVGTHPASGTTTVVANYNFYQDRRTASESLTDYRPVELSGTDIAEMNDTNANAGFIDSTQDNFAVSGLGSYALQPTAPSGGTWTARATISNTEVDGSSNNTYLWQKTTPASVPTTVRPIRKRSDNDLQEMTDTDIKRWTERFRNRAVAGIGQYALSTNAPTSGGTWARRGNAFYDTRKQIANVNYAGTYTGSFTGNYTGTFTGYYSRNFTGYYSRNFTGYYSRSFTGYYGRSFAGNYTRFFGGSNYGTYTGYYSRSFTGFYAGSFAGTYTNSFAGTYTNSFAGTYTRNFSGTYSRNFTGYYTGATIQSSNENVSNMSLWVRTA